jgi:hypothetical protein
MSDPKQPDQKPGGESDTEQTEIALPDGFDDIDGKPDPAAEKVAALEKERNEFKTKLDEIQKQRDELDQKYRTAQGRLKQEHQETVASKPAKTWQDYEKEMLDKFDDNPKEAFRRLIVDQAQDLAYRDALFEKRVKAAEEAAFRRALAADPERGAMVAKIAAFDDDNPDLAHLSIERKLQFMTMTNQSGRPTRREPEDDPIDRHIASDISLDGGGSGRSKTPAWVNDPNVLRDASQHFSSKREMMLWATDPDKARELARQKRQQSA